MRARRGILVALGVLSGLLPVAHAVAADRLTENGARLDPEKIADAKRAVVVRTIDLGGDVPTATFVIARDSTNRMLQRTNDGYWVAWDSRSDSLIDNRVVPQNGKLVVKVFAEDISGAPFPLSITLAYRAGGAFKYGVFPVVVSP